MHSVGAEFSAVFGYVFRLIRVGDELTAIICDTCLFVVWA